MDQDQALVYLRRIVDEAKLTKQERDLAILAIGLLKQVADRFANMNLSQMANEQAAKAPEEPKKNPDAPKPLIDNVDKSTA